MSSAATVVENLHYTFLSIIHFFPIILEYNSMFHTSLNRLNDKSVQKSEWSRSRTLFVIVYGGTSWQEFQKSGYVEIFTAQSRYIGEELMEKNVG